MSEYTGAQPFIFCLWDAEDEGAGRELTERLEQNAYRFYHSRETGDYRQSELDAERLEHCEGVLLLISEAFEKSSRCKNVLSMAVGLNKKLLPVLLGTVKLSLGTKLHLAASNYLRADSLKHEDYLQKVLSCPWFSSCRGSMEEELEAIRRQRGTEREQWLQAWDAETERLLAECGKKWQKPEKQYLLLSLHSGKFAALDGIAAMQTDGDLCRLRAERPLRLSGKELEAGEESTPEEAELLSVENEGFLLLWGDKMKKAKAAGTVALLESNEKKELMLLERELILSRDRPWKNGTLADSRVSRPHARIEFTAKGYTITDTGRDGRGSTNGTWVETGRGSINGIQAETEYLLPGQPRLLKDGDHICLGSEEIRLIFHEISLREE